MFKVISSSIILSFAMTGCFNVHLKNKSHSQTPVVSHGHKKHHHEKKEVKEEEKKSGYGVELFKRS